MGKRTKLEPHLTPEQLQERFRTASDPAERSHFQLLWLISRRHTQAQVAQIVGYSERWVQEVVKRYNADGIEAMRDRRHEHPGRARALDTEGERELAAALQSHAPDGGIWTSRKAAEWISARVGQRVCTVSGWRTLRRIGQTPQRPRPKHTRSDPEAQEAFQEAPPAARRRSTNPASGRGGADLGDG